MQSTYGAFELSPVVSTAHQTTSLMCTASSAFFLAFGCLSPFFFLQTARSFLFILVRSFLEVRESGAFGVVLVIGNLGICWTSAWVSSWGPRRKRSGRPGRICCGIIRWLRGCGSKLVESACEQVEAFLVLNAILCDFI